MWLRAVLLQHPVIDIPEQLGGCDVIGIRLSVLGLAEETHVIEHILPAELVVDCDNSNH